VTLWEIILTNLTLWVEPPTVPISHTATVLAAAQDIAAARAACTDLYTASASGWAALGASLAEPVLPGTTAGFTWEKFLTEPLSLGVQDMKAAAKARGCLISGVSVYFVYLYYSISIHTNTTTVTV
jgi:hypothetical protein